MPIEIRIFSEEDRLKVAAILFKNGYRVEQSKKTRPKVDGSPSKSMDYFIVAEDTRGTGA